MTVTALDNCRHNKHDCSSVYKASGFLNLQMLRQYCGRGDAEEAGGGGRGCWPWTARPQETQGGCPSINRQDSMYTLHKVFPSHCDQRWLAIQMVHEQLYYSRLSRWLTTFWPGLTWCWPGLTWCWPEGFTVYLGFDYNSLGVDKG